MADSDAYMKLSNMLNDMQIELMQHNWPAADRIEKASAFRNALFDAIADYRDYWIEHTNPESRSITTTEESTTSSEEDTHYNALAEAEDEAKALEEEIEEENNAYYESITNPNRI